MGHMKPTKNPTNKPTNKPTRKPTKKPVKKPTKKPVSSPSSSSSDDKFGCNDWKESCLDDDDESKCVEYLKDDDCALCSGDKKEKKKCYKKTGKVFSKAGGWGNVCEAFLLEQPDDGCNDMGEKCVDKGKSEKCVNYL